MKAKLTLIPTPIDDQSPLEPIAKNLLLNHWQDSLVLVEEAKTGRRRWLNWELPREAIDHFILFNEHHEKKDIDQIIDTLKKGKNVFLLSDCGLPAFCDPGVDLVKRCHDEKIQVTSTPFANSIVLALALSGFSHDQFFFAGFLPHKEREKILKSHLKRPETVILMDTPYRLEKLIEELESADCQRRIFLAMDLNNENEQLVRGTAKELKQAWGKREFILILE